MRRRREPRSIALPSVAAALALVAAAPATPLHAQEGGGGARPSRGATARDFKPPRPKLDQVDEFRLRSRLLSDFWKKDRFVEAGVVRPLDWREGEELPVCYSVHGFGGSHEVAWQMAPILQPRMQSNELPRMLVVYLNAQFEWGHHEFADSACNGPWGSALVQEFIPALEQQFGAVGEPWARFVTGHSSGGWSSLWLQVNWPDFFGGCWATAPDSVDFRDFTGIDVYAYDNAFEAPDGAPIMLMRKRSSPEFIRSIRQFVQQERATQPVGGQFFSFNAVFSEPGPDGMPRPLFDWETGAIDREVAESWRKYDLRLILRENWKTLGPKLEGKLHVWIGSIDTFRLEGAVKLLQQELEQLGSDADVVLVDGRDHATLHSPHPEHWPKGMLHRVLHEMSASHERHAAASTPAR